MQRFAIPALSLLLTAGGLLAQQPTYRAATESVQDPVLATLAGGAMLAIPGLFPDFVIAGGGQFVELPNGTARLTGRIHSQSSIFSSFLIDIEFTGRNAPGGANYPPAGSPQLLLAPTAYVPTGPIDPATFVFYTAATGTLIGSQNYSGGRIDVTLGSVAAQLGQGANNRNGVHGLEAALQLTVVVDPPSPFGALTTATLMCDLPNHRTDKATHPQIDSNLSPLTTDRALTLPGIADDYMFVPAGAVTEFDDGHAEINGKLARISQLDDAWQIALLLTSRVDPGEAAHPPVGSPVLQMLASAYAANSGPVEPTHWRYYQTATGTLTGLGINAGGTISLTNSTAVQFGGGANQANLFHGCYGAFAGTVTSQPTSRTIALTGSPELFVLGAKNPVLPFPSLTVPPTPYSLPTLTDQGITLTGDNLAWVELVAVNALLIGVGAERDWYNGWMRIVDNQTIELHPRPGLAPALYDLRVVNPAVVSNRVDLDLTAPTAPTLVAEATIATGATVHLMVHRGPPAVLPVAVIALSFNTIPTVFPGIASLGIGNQGLQLQVVPGSFAHNPVTGIAQFNIGPIPWWYTGFTLHFQAVVADLGNFSFPLPSTNVWHTVF